MPLTPATSVNSRACVDAVLADRRVEHEQHFLRRARHLARGDAPDLVELVHQVHARVQAAGGVDQHRIAPLRLAGRDRVEHDGRGIGAFARAHDVDAGAVRPDFELLDRRGAKRVGGADQRLSPSRLQQIRQLADRRRLAGAVDADDQHHLRAASRRRPAIDGGEDARGSPA